MPTVRDLEFCMTTVPSPAQRGGPGAAVDICMGWGDA